MAWSNVAASRAFVMNPSVTISVSTSAGNLVVVSTTATGTNPATLAVDDGSVTLTNSPKTPSAGNSLWIGLSYYLVPTSGTKTYTVTWTGSGIAIYAAVLNEFDFTGQTAVFDSDFIGLVPTASPVSTPINLPVITPTLIPSGELLYTHAHPSHTVTGLAGAWQRAGPSFGGISEAYILSAATGGTALNFTDSFPSDSWLAIGAAFSDNFYQGQGAAGTADYQWLGGDEE